MRQHLWLMDYYELLFKILYQIWAQAMVTMLFEYQLCNLDLVKLQEKYETRDTICEVSYFILIWPSKTKCMNRRSLRYISRAENEGRGAGIKHHLWYVSLPLRQGRRQPLLTQVSSGSLCCASVTYGSLWVKYCEGVEESERGKGRETK